MKYALPHPNRNKRLTPRHKHLFWCDVCDMALVGNGGKCACCKYRAEPIRMKKVAPTIEEFFE